MDHQLSVTARISLFPPFFLGHFLFSAATVTSLLRDNYPRKAKKPRPCFLSGLVPTLRSCLEAIFQPQRFFFRPFAFSDRFRPVQRQDNNTLDAPRHRLAHETGRTRRHLEKMAAAFLGISFGSFNSFSMTRLLCWRGGARIWQATHKLHSMAIANTFTEYLFGHESKGGWWMDGSLACCPASSSSLL